MSVVYIDANVFIDLLEGNSDTSLRLGTFFEALRAKPGAAVTSDLTRAEVLGKEAPTIGWEKQKDFYRGLFDFNVFIGVMPVSRAILVETGELRRSARREGRQIKLADAIHLATALSLGCRYLLSSDRRLAWPSTLRSVTPNEKTLHEILATLDA